MRAASLFREALVVSLLFVAGAIAAANLQRPVSHGCIVIGGALNMGCR
jgi:hypothetical protein